MLSDEELKKTVRFVYEFKAKNGYCPCVREISENIGRNLSTTHNRLSILRKKGYIVNEPMANRTWTVTKTGVRFAYGDEK